MQTIFIMFCVLSEAKGMDIKMITFNKNYYFVENKIYKKDNSIYFIIPNELFAELQKININNYNDCLVQYLLEKQILVESSVQYNPFVKSNFNYNKFRLFIQLTGNCNLCCKHCFLGGSSNRIDFFDFEKIKILIDKACHLGIFNIDFTGGEIFTATFLPDILSYIDNLPISSTLFTNLAFLSSNQLNLLINCSSICEIVTSLDYFSSAKHDDFRGRKGAFDSTMHSIHALKDAGIPITINCMILKDNYKDILEMIDYFSNWNINIHLDTVFIKGNAKKNQVLFNTRNQDNEEINLLGRYIKYQHCQDNLLEYMSNDKCGVGETLLYIDKNGNFQLCPGLTSEDNKQFHMGNTIEEAANKMMKINVECEKKNCKFHNKCSFGCREHALKKAGSVNAPDYRLCKLFELLE